MRIARVCAVLIATGLVVGLPALVAGQWLKYPTADLPRTADGKPNLTAPTPRLPDGKPDFSGIWHASNPNRCIQGVGRFVECGTEIGGSPLGGNLGRELPDGLPSGCSGPAASRSLVRPWSLVGWS